MRAAKVLLVLAVAAASGGIAVADFEVCRGRGRRCSTPPPRLGGAQAETERAIAAAGRLEPGERIVVPLVYHVVYGVYHVVHATLLPGPPDAEPDDLDHAPPLALVRRQTRVLNRAFRGTGISFVAAAAEVRSIDPWRMTSAPGEPPLTSELAAMMRAANAERPSALHVFLFRGADNVSASLDTNEIFAGSPGTDGIMMDWDYLPADPTLYPVHPEVSRRYTEGETLVHLVGHYFGLLHTFEPGPGEEEACRPRCGQTTDYVSDTPSHRLPLEEADVDDADLKRCFPIDTCKRLPGLDPVNNYMNMVPDYCAREFTPGQVERIERMVRFFRPHFVVPAATERR